MYRKDDTLIGCLAAIFFLVLGLGVGFGVLYLLTHLVIWFANGMFNYDLSDKFWYVFVALIILNAIFGGKVCSVRVKR